MQHLLLHTCACRLLVVVCCLLQQVARGGLDAWRAGHLLCPGLRLLLCWGKVGRPIRWSFSLLKCHKERLQVLLRPLKHEIHHRGAREASHLHKLAGVQRRMRRRFDAWQRRRRLRRQRLGGRLRLPWSKRAVPRDSLLLRGVRNSGGHGVRLRRCWLCGNRAKPCK